MDFKGPLASVLAAFGLSVLNAVIGFIVARWAFGKELNTFLGIVFGSFGIRSIMVITCIWLCLGPLDMHQTSFAITFAISSFLFLMAEIFFFHQWYEKQKRKIRRPVSDLLKKNDDLVPHSLLNYNTA